METTASPETQSEAIRTVAQALAAQGTSQPVATEMIRCLLNTSASTVNRWAAEIVASVY